MLLENIKVISVNEPRSGVSETTGKPWSQRSILLGFEDETGESYLLAKVDSALWDSLGYSEGQTVSLNLRFRTKRYRGDWVANDVRIVRNVEQ